MNALESVLFVDVTIPDELGAVLEDHDNKEEQEHIDADDTESSGEDQVEIDVGE